MPDPLTCDVCHGDAEKDTLGTAYCDRCGRFCCSWCFGCYADGNFCRDCAEAGPPTEEKRDAP